MSAIEQLKRLLSMPEIAVWGGVMVPPDLARDALRESGVDVEQPVADMSASDVKAYMMDGSMPSAKLPGGVG